MSHGHKIYRALQQLCKHAITRCQARIMADLKAGGVRARRGFHHCMPRRGAASAGFQAAGGGELFITEFGCG